MANLPPHSPSCPSRPPVAAIWYIIVNNATEVEHHFAIHTYGAIYAAKHWLDHILDANDIEPNWQNEEEFQLKGETYTLRVKGNKLEDIMEHTLTKAEQTWTIPIPDIYTVQRLAAFDKVVQRQTQPAPTETTEQAPKRERKKPKRKLPTGNQVTVAEMADNHNMSAGKARNLLRKAKFPKPANGWTVDSNSAEHKAILAILKKGQS